MGVHISYVCIRLDGLTNLIDLHNSDFVLLFICMLDGRFLGWWVGGLVGWLVGCFEDGNTQQNHSTIFHEITQKPFVSFGIWCTPYYRKRKINR